jgi:Xaa-Pro aminopeptidase
MTTRTAPQRGFPDGEFEHRTSSAQQLMAQAGFDALLLTTEPEVRWFTGFHSQFWHSPTRPWFVVVPAQGKPVAVIPAIGESGMAQTWVDDVRVWSSPDRDADGLAMLVDCLRACAQRHRVIGVPMGHESHVRLPMNDFEHIREQLHDVRIADARPLMRGLREIKSELEIDKIRHICALTGDAFAALPSLIGAGMTEREICTALKLEILHRGADDVPYLIAGSGRGGYDSIIMGPTDRIVEHGDVLIIDTGAVFDGYFCDFDRNFAFGVVDDAVRAAHEVCWDATQAGIEAARPGASAQDLWRAMWQVLETGGALGSDVGRLGHGLGMQLTEGHSNMCGDETVMRPGLVTTLEPGMAFAPGKLMVHEEDIVIREEGCELLTARAGREMCQIG